MKNRLFRGLAFVSLAAVAAPLTGCSYAGAAVSGDKVVVLRNDNLLFGYLRKAYVCKVTESGLSNCQTAEAP